jgi:hypothetical protein
VPFTVEEPKDAKPLRIVGTREWGEALLRRIAGDMEELLQRTPAVAPEYEASDEDFRRDLDTRFLRRRAREAVDRLSRVGGKKAA